MQDAEHAKINPYVWTFIILVLLFFALRLPFISKEYVPEEVIWVRGGAGVAATGFQWTYMGEQSPGDWAKSKGPILPWLLGAAYRLFGEHEYVSRSVPLIFAAGQLVLLYFISRKIFGMGTGRKIGLLAMFLVSINPLAIQNAVQIDLDGGLVGFFALLIVYFAWTCIHEEKNRRRNTTLLFLASASGFLVRFDTLLMIFFAVVLYALIVRKNNEAIKLIKIFAVAVIAAIVIFAIYNAVFGQFQKTFVPLRSLLGTLSSQKMTAAPRIFDVFPQGKLGAFEPVAAALFPSAAFATSTLLWLTIPFAILLVFTVGRLILEKKYKSPGVLFPLLSSAIISSAFTIVAPAFNFPRYMIASILLFSIAASAYIVDTAERNLFPDRKKLLAIVILMFFAAIIVFSLTPLKAALFEDRTRANPLLAGFAFAASIAIAIALLAFARQPKRAVAACLCLVALYAAFSAIIVCGDFQKPYSLSAYYGNYGFKDAGNFLKKIAGPGDVVAATDTIGYYYGRPYYDAMLYSQGKIPGLHPTLIAVYNTPPHRFDHAIEGAKMIASFGTVEIYSAPN